MNKLTLPRNLAQTGITMQSTGQQIDLYLFGVIGDWWDGNTANDVLYRFQSCPDTTPINVYISSVGGYFEDGLPIFNLLRMNKGEVTVNVIGYALSMASHIMLAADKVRIAQNGQIMIHNAQSYGRGDYRDLEKAAAVLKNHNNSLIPEYQRRMGLSTEAIQTLMDDETWYTADQALAAGLVDEIIDPVDKDAVDRNQTANAVDFATKNFKHPPADFVDRMATAAKQKDAGWVQNLLNRVVGPPAAVFPPAPTESEDTMTQQELEAILAKQSEAMAQLLDDKLAALKPADPPEPPVAPVADDGKDAQIKALEDQLTAANAELAALKEPAPFKPSRLEQEPAGAVQTQERFH